MTALVAGMGPAVAELVRSQTGTAGALPTYRCTDCTLMRCYISGTSCSECLDNAALQPKVMCCMMCGTAWQTGQVTCGNCGGYVGIG